VRPFFLAILGFMLAGIVLFGSSDNTLSIADTSGPDNEIASSKASNSSATAGTRITMTGLLDE